MPKAAKSLKTQNLTYLIGALIADAALVAFVAGVIDADWFSAANFKRAASASIIPVLALLLTNVIPVNLRDSLAHLRWSEALPGHRAFTEYGPGDSRVDMAAVEKNLGKLPTDPKEQDRTWYKLYKQVRDEPSVLQSHQRYLLFRDLTAMSTVMLIASPALALAFDWRVVGWAALLLLVQAVLCAIASRNCGIRFITNVLVLHGAEAVAKPKAAPKTKKAEG